MASPVSSEKPKGVTVREIAAAMKRTRDAGEKILAVLGPAVVHTGSVEHICQLIRSGYLNILFAGNALATHDIEQSLYGTSLGIYLDRGLPAEEGHEHHLRAINTIRRAGQHSRPPSTRGILKSGIMYECIKHDIPFVLAGSIRDDGPLPEVITDVLDAQQRMRELIHGVGFCLMMATAAALDRDGQSAAGLGQGGLRRHQPRHGHQADRPRQHPDGRRRHGRGAVPAGAGHRVGRLRAIILVSGLAAGGD